MTDNELIAKFHEGIEFDENGFCTDREEKYSWMPGCYDILQSRHLKYHESWDWLMPVVEKINGLYDENFPKDFVQKVLAKEKNIIDDHYIDVIVLPMSTPIGEVYQNVVKFIKWYNEKIKPDH